jgi:hypothetical protein
VLKGAAGLAGAAVGSGAITGFPAIWAQEEKVLRYLGTAVNQSDDITKKVKADTGITIENIVATTDDVTKRVITQPNSFDVLDTEYFSLKKLGPVDIDFKAGDSLFGRNLIQGSKMETSFESTSFERRTMGDDRPPAFGQARRPWSEWNG